MPDHEIQTDLTRVIAQLTAAVTNTGLYSSTHPKIAEYIDHAFAALTTMLSQKPEVTVLLIGDDLVAENKPLSSGGAYVVNFARILKKKAIERMSFLPGLTKEELQSLIRDLAHPDGGAVHSSRYIKLGKVELRVKKDNENSSSCSDSAQPVTSDALQAELQSLMELTAVELDELKELYLRIKKHRQIDVRGVDDIVKGFITGFKRELNPLSLLASLKTAHEYTFTHVTNVGILTMSQAEMLGFTGDHLHQIGIASLLHDVGKLFIPEEILNKPTSLTTDERKIVETHTVKGSRYLMGLEGIAKLAVLAAMEHHLKYDGTGYPSIKGGWRPNIVSQMITIADVFDAMRSRRSYQEPIPQEKIEDVLKKGSGTAFNPFLVENFLKIIRR